MQKLCIRLLHSLSWTHAYLVLIMQYNQRFAEWFCLSGSSLTTLSWKRGCYMGVVVAVVAKCTNQAFWYNNNYFMALCPGLHGWSRTYSIRVVCVVRDYPGKPVTEETFTHSHLSWSSTILYQLPVSTMIDNILPTQFMCLTVFWGNFSPNLLWSTSWSGTLHFILYTFLHPQHMPILTQPVLLQYQDYVTYPILFRYLDLIWYL